MSDTKSKTERTLDRSGTKQTLQGIIGDTDAADLDIFGFEVIYTTGEFTVDRAALLAKAAEVGIPEWMLPSQVQPHYAFGRMIDDLLDGREEMMFKGNRVQFDLRKNDSRYSYTLSASVYFSPEDTQTDDGQWVQHELGVIRYENPDEGEPHIQFLDRIDAGKSLAPLWGIRQNDDNEVETDGLSNYDSMTQALDSTFRARAEALWEKHQESHNGKDVNNTIYYLTRTWTDSIRLRDACYFVPANHIYRDDDGEERPISDLLDAFMDLYDWLDQNAEKPRGAEQTHLDIIEIMDTERQREMVEHKVESRLREMADDMAEQTIDSLQDDDAVVDDVVAEVSNAMKDLQQVAGEYDDLMGGGRSVDLKTESAVRRAVRRSLRELGDDKEERVKDILDKAGIDTAEAEEAAA